MTIRPSPEPRSYTTSSLLTFASSSIRSTTATGVGTNGASGAFSCADAPNATAVASAAIRTACARIPFAPSKLELDRIDIEVPAYLAGAQAVKRLRPLTEKPLQRAPRARLREHLRPLAARDPREGHRHRV